MEQWRLPEELTLARLGPADTEAAWLLQEEVVRELTDPESYAPISRKQLTDVLGDQGLAVGLWQGARLVGFYSACYPCPYVWMLERAGLGVNELAISAYVLAILVHPEWRRRGLQKQMGFALRRELLRWQPVRYLLVVVHPQNLPSIREQFSQGMQAISQEEMFGGKLRLLFFHDLQRSTPVADRWTAIPLAAHIPLRAALNARQLGIGLEETASGWSLLLATPPSTPGE